jgi:hypothetical protein
MITVNAFSNSTFGANATIQNVNINIFGKIINEQSLEDLILYLQNRYQSPEESEIELNIGDEPCRVNVGTVFVNLSIVKEETQKLHEKRQLDQQISNIHAVGHHARQNMRSDWISPSFLTRIRNEKMEIGFDSETIYNTKADIRPEKLFDDFTITEQRNAVRRSVKQIFLLGRAGVGKA